MKLVDSSGAPLIRKRNRIGMPSSLTSIVNPISGMGGRGDKSTGSFFAPTYFYDRRPIDILYAQSAAGAKAIDIPVDDMFLKWREWGDGEVDGAGEVMAVAERNAGVTSALAGAMKGGSAYGTAVLLMVTRETGGDLMQPLVPEQLREGDLAALHVFDRWELAITGRNTDLFSPEFQRPTMYRVQPRWGGGPFEAHASRFLRFDGILGPTGRGMAYYDQDFGISEYIRILTSLLQDQSIATAITHLSQEASIPVVKISNLAEKAAGYADAEEQSMDAIGDRINVTKSIFRVMMLDKQDEEFERVGVTFTGLGDLMDRFQHRIAAARDIPQTRFNGNPPTGMNATGDSDMRNYAIMVEAKRMVRLARPLPILDEVVARSAGLQEAPPYRWLSLMEMGEAELATAAHTLVLAYRDALLANIVTEDEMRAQLDGHPLFGELPPIDLDALKMDDEPPEPEE